MIKQDSNVTYFPTGELVITTIPGDSVNADILAYKFDIFSEQPLARKWIYIDAISGTIVKEAERIQTTDANGLAITRYSGLKIITTDLMSNGTYRLRETGRGNGIQTFDMNGSSNYGWAVDFVDNDNYWYEHNNTQKDNAALDAHWGTEITYDYFMSRYNRNSIDGNGHALINYVHANLVGMGGFTNNVNAFWNGSFMTYGDGDQFDPLTSLDIIGHEITHGLTEHTANLIYQNESGALNESFSDIFGTAIEFYAKPNDANWTLGEDFGLISRDMAYPNAYGDPDTYHGTHWYYGSYDHGGVHTNSGVQNYWFYLLATGGNGTNDNGHNYSVTGIGICLLYTSPSPRD